MKLVATYAFYVNPVLKCGIGMAAMESVWSPKGGKR